MRKFSRLLLFVGLVIIFRAAYAEDKTWVGSGDGTSWSDEENWNPGDAPTLASDVTITTEDASVVCGETFGAKSITIGGREDSKLTVENFIYGTVAPTSTEDTAILNRAGGTIVLKKIGGLTVKGKYVDSESALGPEPSFMFWVE